LLTPEKMSTCGAATFTNLALSSGTLKAPFDGVLTRWRVDVGAPSGILGYKLRVLHPAGGASYIGAGTGPAQPALAAGVNLLTLPTPLPIQAGDIVAVDCPAGAPSPANNAAKPGSTFAFFNPMLADGKTAGPTNQIPGEEELFNADLVGVPAITSISPASGSTSGGAVVTITGTRLADVTGVTFGGVPATGVVPVSETEVRATAPAHPIGAAEVHAVNAAGSSPIVAADLFVYVDPPITISGFSQSHRTWRAGSKLAVISSSPAHKAPLGTTFSFGLDPQGRVVLAFAQKLPGRKVKGKCVPPVAKNEGKKACGRAVVRGRLSWTGHVGTNKVYFQGRTPSSKLKPGRYTVTATATNSGGVQSKSKPLAFTIVK